MRGNEIPTAEIERVRAFMKRCRRDSVQISDDEMVGPHLKQTRYRDFLRLLAWWGITRAEEEAKKPPRGG